MNTRKNNIRNRPILLGAGLQALFDTAESVENYQELLTRIALHDPVIAQTPCKIAGCEKTGCCADMFASIAVSVAQSQQALTMRSIARDVFALFGFGPETVNHAVKLLIDRGFMVLTTCKHNGPSICLILQPEALVAAVQCENCGPLLANIDENEDEDDDPLDDSQGPVEIDHEVLMCPRCDGNYLHQGRVVVYNRKEDEPEAEMTVVEPGRVYTNEKSKDTGPSERRQGLSRMLGVRSGTQAGRRRREPVPAATGRGPQARRPGRHRTVRRQHVPDRTPGRGDPTVDRSSAPSA